MDRKSNNIVRDIKVDVRNRAKTRITMLEHWMREDPGTDEIRNTYTYFVEMLSDGSRIFLKRPAYKNKGCDFVILCEGFNLSLAGNPKPPSQNKLIGEITELASPSPAHKEQILKGIYKVWLCENPDEVLASLPLFQGNLIAERALKLAKWLFIEQDVTYWTESGRNMLLAHFESSFGPIPRE
ncbi:MAG TPA: hypothetical protein VHC95_03895 [Opitutales bacterium]|nr:hypothetical protein [Opitutales bacterium]